MSSNLYKFHLDSVTIYWSVIHILFFALGGVILFWLYDGGLFSAWFIAFIVAVLILMTLSIPRNIVLDEESLTINSVLDITVINIADIKSICKVSPRKIRWVLPVFGASGFFGYYGHFFDFKSLHRIMIYATEWRYLVEIVDVYEDYYYISCRDRDELLSKIYLQIECRKR